jgi:hypothetical protein
MKIIIFAIVIASTCLNALPITFEDLLKCNLSNRDIASECDFENEILIYREAVSDESNCSLQLTLESWNNYPYPNIHPLHRILLDIIKGLNVSSVAEIGAGCGRLSKYLYAENPLLKLTCIENNSIHLKQIDENFRTRTGVILPNIRVPANIIQGCLPDLYFLKSNSFDLVFTSTLMMHLPFIPAVFSALEIKRISSKYILHLENKNDGIYWYNMTINKPDAMSPSNMVAVDYVKLYESVGVKTLKYLEFKDPNSPATFVFYLGEK